MKSPFVLWIDFAGLNNLLDAWLRRTVFAN